MAHFIDNLGQFFEEFLRCVREGITGLSSEYEPNRVDSLLCRLTEFERTLGLISSRVGERGSNDQLLEDLERLLTSVRLLKTRYQARRAESVPSPDMEAAHLPQHGCSTQYLGHACRPRLAVDKSVVQQLREESMKWVDIARIVGISPKTLIRRRMEFEMPIGADAFTCIEDGDLDEHVRGILRLNPEAGIFYDYGILHIIATWEVHLSGRIERIFLELYNI